MRSRFSVDYLQVGWVGPPLSSLSLYFPPNELIPNITAKAIQVRDWISSWPSRDVTS